jgi:2-(1,2-epoxy-1,2-dihydrophenyl)acetyl-CoA isomerase
MGMIYKCYPAEQFQEAVQKFAEQLAQMPTKGLGLTKRLLNACWQNDLSQQLKLEGAVQVEASETHDYQEGVRAFLEKRPAQFKGH